MLLESDIADSVANTLSFRAAELQNKLKPGMSLEQQYYHVVRNIATATTYVDSGSGFWDHTCAGPVLRGSGVCEAIAKLFLLPETTASLRNYNRDIKRQPACMEYG